MTWIIRIVKRERDDDELTTVPVRLWKLCAEDGRVEAGAILAGLRAVFDDHAVGEGRVNVAVDTDDHSRDGGRLKEEGKEEVKCDIWRLTRRGKTSQRTCPRYTVTSPPQPGL
jgi:hypothetical protein